MELKDVILSTLAEMEEVVEEKEPVVVKKDFSSKVLQEKTVKKPEIIRKKQPETSVVKEKPIKNEEKSNAEMLYLNSIRERLLVLFEGFQAPNNTNLEAKVDMTLNFLEYVLATIDTRIETLEKGK